MRSSWPITGQWFLCEHPGPRNYCCILGQTAAAVQFFECPISAQRTGSPFQLEELVSRTIVQLWYFASEKIWNFLWRYWLSKWLCTNLTVQEAAFHSMSGLGPFTPCLIFPCAHQSRIDAYRTWKLVQNYLLSLILLTAHNAGYVFYQLYYGLTSSLAFESLCKHLAEAC